MDGNHKPAVGENPINTHSDLLVGRYMREVRHSLNNALTSVLGNAELLMLGPDSLPQPVRDQLANIHTGALRLHEIMQRLARLEAEAQVVMPEAVPAERAPELRRAAGE